MGHWEGDTVYGQDSYLVTMVERVTKILLTCRVKTKTKENVARAIKKMLKPLQLKLTDYVHLKNLCLKKTNILL